MTSYGNCPTHPEYSMINCPICCVHDGRGKMKFNPTFINAFAELSKMDRTETPTCPICTLRHEKWITCDGYVDEIMRDEMNGSPS